MVYFRLLGRLAWHCSNRPAGDADEEEDFDEE
jgi:hypothetical protein